MRPSPPSLPPVIQQPKDRLIVALSVGAVEDALRLVNDLTPYVGGFAVGPHLAMRHDSRLSTAIQRSGLISIVDVKLIHTPENVAWMIASLGDEFHAHFMTVHIAGGSRMIDQAVRMARSMPWKTKILVDTFLHSQTDADFLRLTGSEPERKIIAYTGEAKIANADGILCAAQKLTLIRDMPTNNRFYRIGTGIRIEPTKTGDRVFVTPLEALQARTDYLLVGKAIAQDPAPIDKAKGYVEAITRALVTLSNEAPQEPKAIGA